MRKCEKDVKIFMPGTVCQHILKFTTLHCFSVAMRRGNYILLTEWRNCHSVYRVAQKTDTLVVRHNFIRINFIKYWPIFKHFTVWNRRTFV